MADELWETLMRFHREVAMPEIVRQVADPVRQEIADQRRYMDGHFDAIYKRFDRLESEMISMNSATNRRINGLEQRIADDEKK